MISCDLTKNFIIAAKRFQNRIAIKSKIYDRWEQFTYNELHKKVRALAFFLSSIGVKRSDKVAIILENRLEWPVIFFAISYAGAIAVPIAPGTPHKDISLILTNSESRFIFIPEENRVLHAFLKTLGSIEEIITAPFENFQDAPEFFKPVTAEPDDLAVLLYTSGTTQEPKGVMLTHKNLCANFNSINKLKLFSPMDSILAILPFFHSYSLMTTLIMPVFSGIKVVYAPPDWPEKLTEYMKEARVSILIGVPQIFSMMHGRMMKKMKELPNFLKPFVKLLARRAFGPRFRFFVSGGAKLDKNITDDFLKLGLKILEGYGLTETSPVVSMNPLKSPRPGSCGKPVPDVQADVINKNREGIGEIVVKGPNVMKGYYKDEAKTRSSFKDGWLLTGDLGHIDSDGYIYITGRSKEVIVLSSGKNIYPEEIEKHYSKASFIKEMCVIGVARQKGASKIEYLHAIIAPKEASLEDFKEGEARDVIKKELEELGKELPGYKHIMGFTVIKDNLPRTVLGKIKRYEIEKKFFPIILEEEKRKESILSEGERILAESDIGKKVIFCIKEALDISTPIKLSDSIELDLGADSLGVIELASSIEKCFGVELDEDMLQRGVSTVRDLILKVKEVLENKTGEKHE
ncbi:MAG: AMP-binding protein [Candidatus Omnitrophica bacterium]|nr:AMP-binding protein [Candidatus Omnitrophota bacterium]